MKAVIFENEAVALSTRAAWQSTAPMQEELIAFEATDVERQARESGPPILSSEPLSSGGMPNQPFARKFCKPCCAMAETRNVQYSASELVLWSRRQVAGRM
jgi:hypothetical protein